MLLRRRPHGTQGRRKWHRSLAVVAWIPFICFPASGMFHVVMQSPLMHEKITHPVPALSLKSLPPLPKKTVQDLRLVILPDGSALWHDRSTDDQALALRLAGMMTNAPVPDTAEKIITFSNQYGFAYKRLPVWMVAMKTGETLFIEPQTATLAAKTTRLETTENWSFTIFHKWQFLDPYISMGKRDSILITIVLTGIVMALTGLLLLIKKRK